MATKEIDVSIGGCGGWFTHPSHTYNYKNKIKI
jgi:hypothetical protein